MLQLSIHEEQDSPLCIIPRNSQYPVMNTRLYEKALFGPSHFPVECSERGDTPNSAPPCVWSRESHWVQPKETLRPRKPGWGVQRAGEDVGNLLDHLRGASAKEILSSLVNLSASHQKKGLCVGQRSSGSGCFSGCVWDNMHSIPGRGGGRGILGC